MSAAFPCPRCGAPIRRVKRPTRREIACPRCRFLMFDYPRACVGFIVLRGEEVLVLRRAHLPRRGWLDLPGGFLEAGESPEAGARRELLEETGLSVGKADWLGLYWDRYFLRGFGGFPTLNFYWVARWRSGEPRAMDDAASAEWRPLATLGRAGDRLAWKHMRDVLRDLRASQRLRTGRARLTSRSRPSAPASGHSTPAAGSRSRRGRARRTRRSRPTSARGGQGR